MATAPVQTRITEMLGIEKPVIQAAMGWIARAPLSSAFSNAGGMGIIETSSGELDVIREEILKMHDLTDKPFGVNEGGRPHRVPCRPIASGRAKGD